RRWGRAEAEVLLRVATDSDRPAPVREWAWSALAAADPKTCLQAADHCSRGDPRTARAAVMAVALVGGWGPRSMLRALSDRRSEVRAAARWALSRLGERRSAR